MDVEDLLDLFHQCILMMIFSIDVSSWMLDILDFFITTSIKCHIQLQRFHFGCWIFWIFL